MSEPLRAKDSVVQGPAAAPPLARQALDPLEAYRLRGDLTPAELALIALVDRRSRLRGHCYAGQKHIADELLCSDRNVRYLIRSLHEKGLLAIKHRRGGTALLWLTPACGKAVENVPPPRKAVSAPPGNALPTQGGNALPPNLRPYPRTTPEPKEGSADDPGPLFRRTRFNPFDYRPREKLFNDSPADRLAHAFKQRMFLFVEHEGRVRTIDRIVPRDAGALIYLIDESAPDAEPQRVAVPNRELGSWKFWR